MLHFIILKERKRLDLCIHMYLFLVQIPLKAWNRNFVMWLACLNLCWSPNCMTCIFNYQFRPIIMRTSLNQNNAFLFWDVWRQFMEQLFGEGRDTGERTSPICWCSRPEEQSSSICAFGYIYFIHGAGWHLLPVSDRWEYREKRRGHLGFLRFLHSLDLASKIYFQASWLVQIDQGT